MKRMSRPAATLAFQSSSEKLSVPSEPAQAVGRPRRATARATFQPAPPGCARQLESVPGAPVCAEPSGAAPRTRSVRMSPAEMKAGKPVEKSGPVLQVLIACSFAESVAGALLVRRRCVAGALRLSLAVSRGSGRAVRAVGTDVRVLFLAPDDRRHAASGQRVQDFVARAHGVIVGLAGRALFVAVLAVVAGEDAIPRAIAMIDEMLPAVAPDLVVPVPEALVAGALAEQRGGGEGLGLDPEILVVIADGVVGPEAVVEAAVIVVPGVHHGRVEQLDRARQQPRQRTMTFENQQQLGPLGLVARLETPRAEDVRAVFLVVVPVDRPVGVKVLPDQPLREPRLTQRDVRRDALGAVEIDQMAGRLVGREQRLGGVHVGVLAAIAGDLPVGARFVGIEARRAVPEAMFHQLEGGGDHRLRFFDAGHRGVRVSEQHEGEAVAVARGVERALLAVAPVDLPVVALELRVPMHFAQELQAVARVVEMLRLAGFAVRHRVVEHVAAAAHEMARMRVVDRAVVAEIVEEAARRVVHVGRVEAQRVGDMAEQEGAVPKARDGGRGGLGFNGECGVGWLRHGFLISAAWVRLDSVCYVVLAMRRDSAAASGRFGLRLAATRDGFQWRRHGE
ncbi:hypothetical protein PT2222_10287 [Paraburkholderia tropica]